MGVTCTRRVKHRLEETMSYLPYLDEPSSTVRFCILVSGSPLRVSIGTTALHYRFRPTATGEDPLETFRANEREIEAAVLRRLAGGSLEPVILREFDIRQALPDAGR
jgi:hypothetical protein